MKALLTTLALLIGLVPMLATDHSLAQAEADATNVKTLVLNGGKNETSRLLKLAPKLTALESVIFDGISDDQTAGNLVASVAACNKVRTVNFRNCVLTVLPANLRMLTQVVSFHSENSTVQNEEQFYSAIADMPNVVNVTVISSDFRSLPKSFARMRVMNNITLVNNDLQLAGGYELNNKTPDQLRATETVQFGLGDDALNLNYTCYNAEAGKSHVQMFRDVLQGAYRESNVFYSPADSRIFRKQHPLVKPPVNGVDITPDIYSVNAMTGSVVTYGSGTRISIPAMAFEDANGTPVQGKVDITYREFRDPVDILLSGIPMKYDSAGFGGDFKSAGMFEIEASQNGSEVFLREGKQVDLKFQVTDTAAAYDFYRLDEQKGWVYLTDPGKAESDGANGTAEIATTRQPVEGAEAILAEVVPADSGVRIVVKNDSVADWTTRSFAVSLYMDGIAKVRVRDWIKDTTEFDRRYSDTTYFGTEKSKVYKGSDRAWESTRKASSRIYFRKRGSGKDYTMISIGQVSERAGLNPEMAAYNGYYWKLDGKMSGKQVTARFGRKSGLNDCRVIQEGSDYYLELKYYWGFDKIKATPVKVDNDNKPQDLSENKKQKLFDQYTKRLNNRRNAMARNNAQQVKFHQTRVQRAHNDSVRVWKGLIKQMNAEEKAMDFRSWNDYVKRENRKMRAMNFGFNGNTPGEAAAYQALSIEGMGIYNCDQVSRMSKPKNFVARTITAGGAVIVPVCIFVIDKIKNMVFRYGGVWSFENKPVAGPGLAGSYDAGSTSQMLATDKSGNLYMIDEAEFASKTTEGNKSIDFNGVQLGDGTAVTPESVRQAVFPEHYKEEGVRQMPTESEQDK